MSFSLLYSRFAFLLFYVPSNSLSPSLQNLLYCYLPSMLYYTRQYSTLYSTSSTIFFSTIFYSLLPTQCLPLSFSIIFSSLFLSLPPHLSRYTLSSLLLRSIQQYLILLLSFNLPPSLSLSLYSSPPSPSLLSIYFFHFPFLPCFLYLILHLFLHVLGGCSSFLERNRAGLAERSVLHFPETRSIRPYQTIARYVRANF